MTSQIVNTLVHSDSGFQCWHYDQPELGRTSVLLENGDGELRAVLDSDLISFVVEFNRTSDQELLLRNWHVAARREDQVLSRLALLSILDVVFTQNSDVQWVRAERMDIEGLLPCEIFRATRLQREHFYQWPQLWLQKGCVYPEPVSWTTTGEVKHPRRMPQPQGTFYRRFIADINKTLSFKVVDPVQDLDLFHEWMNQTRIAPIWELGLPKPELKEYLLQREADDHIYSVFGYFNDEPFGYFELYWSPEDRLGPYYAAEDFDRGLHLLVGERRFLGAQYFNAWLTGLTHFLFLDDPRTQRVMGEPRADNQALLKHLATVPAYQKLKEFDFPHKRAALLECTRERFFDQIILP